MLIIEELGFVLRFHLPAFGQGLLQGFTPALPNCPPLPGLRLKVQQWLVADTLAGHVQSSSRTPMGPAATVELISDAFLATSLGGIQ